MKIEIHIDDRMVRPFAWLTGSRPRLAAVAAIAVMGSAVALAAPGDSVPNAFTNGITLTAESLNANFNELSTQIGTVDAMNVWSETEVQIGYWGVNKTPLYRKVVSFDGGPSTGNDRLVPHGASIGNLIRYHGRLYHPTDGAWQDVNFSQAGTSNYLTGYVDGTSIVLASTKDWSSTADYQFQFVLEYTKP